MKVDITLVLDRSGSMSSIRDATLEGVNSFLTKQREEPGEATFTLVQFDDYYEIVHDAIPLADVPLLSVETFVPRGSTALLDAMGKTINNIKTRQKLLSDADKPAKTILVIVTDGGENSSQEYSRDQVFEIVKALDDVEDWDIIYLGANQDAITVAARMGIRSSSSASYLCSAGNVGNVYKNLSRTVSSNRNTRSYSKTVFSAVERDEMISPVATEGKVDISTTSGDLEINPDASGIVLKDSDA